MLRCVAKTTGCHLVSLSLTVSAMLLCTIKALKCKTLGAEFIAYTLYSIISAFYADDHLPTLNAPSVNEPVAMLYSNQLYTSSNGIYTL